VELLAMGEKRLDRSGADRTALIDFLAAPSAAPVYKANGMEPGQPPITRR
jgi:hypothetical protein